MVGEGAIQNPKRTAGREMSQSFLLEAVNCDKHFIKEELKCSMRPSVWG